MNMEKFKQLFNKNPDFQENGQIFKTLPEKKERQVLNLHLKFKTQINGAISLLCASTLVLIGSATLDYFETHENNLFSTESYSIIVDGEEICKVREAEILEPTIESIKSDLEEISNSDLVLENKFEITGSVAKDSEITKEENLYNVLKPKIKYKMLAYSININGQSIGIVESQQVANNIIENVKAYFTENYDQSSIIDVSTVENIEIKQVKVDNTEIKDTADIKNYIIKGTTEEKKYIVEEGDTYWTIAEYFNMSLDELITANPNSDPERIQIGDELNLIVPKPFVSIQVKRKVVQEEKTEYETEYEYVSYMYNDEETVKVKGEYGISKIESIVTEQNGIQVSKEVVSEEIITNPKTKVVITGTQDPPPKKGTGYFINPLPASSISSRFGSRSGGFHSGLDMAKPSGSSIKAADGGTVIFSGWQGSYGLMVEIDHGGGFTTRYAHCSELYVKSGEKVYQGKVVGAVGTTGVATGPHLHFEVRKYGTAVNPSSYIGVQYR
jgi:murein DD-endopeptidase MepM/ murein hydrolase activator NlpD